MNFPSTENENITEVVLESQSMAVDHSLNAFLPQPFSASPTTLGVSVHKDLNILTSDLKTSTGVHEELTNDNSNCISQTATGEHTNLLYVKGVLLHIIQFLV